MASKHKKHLLSMPWRMRTVCGAYRIVGEEKRVVYPDNVINPYSERGEEYRRACERKRVVHLDNVIASYPNSNVEDKELLSMYAKGLLCKKCWNLREGGTAKIGDRGLLGRSRKGIS